MGRSWPRRRWCVQGACFYIYVLMLHMEPPCCVEVGTLEGHVYHVYLIGNVMSYKVEGG